MKSMQLLFRWMFFNNILCLTKLKSALCHDMIYKNKLYRGTRGKISKGGIECY